MSVIAAKAVGAAVQAVTAAVEANLKSSGWGRYSLNFQTSKLKTNSHKIKLLKLSAFLAVQVATQNSKTERCSSVTSVKSTKKCRKKGNDVTRLFT